MRVRKADLGRLIPLGKGAIGEVFRVSDYRLSGDQTEFVYKEFTRDHARQARSADAVVSFREMLSQVGRDELDRYAVWPRALVEDKGNVTGLLMALIPDEFFCDREDPDTGDIR